MKAIFIALLVTPLFAEEKEDNATVPAGHSAHGEAFDEGPRQRAYLMKGMPKVNFPVTTKKPKCQAFFNQGLGQLHGFWNLEAERSFRQAAVIDPTCSMAYWGMARANSGNEKRAKGFIAEAVKRKGSASPREVKHVDALAKYVNTPKEKKAERAEAYAKALEEILYEFPDDLETRALLALQFWVNSRNGVKIQSHEAVDALLQGVFKVNPMHPAHHYRIHLWDYKRAARAVDSAAVCGQAAPGIAHMWHMSGHIYSKLKRYHDAARSQEASARTDHAYMRRDRVMPDQIHNFAHNNEWLCRNLATIGRAGEAVALARNMISLPRHPKYNTLAKRGGSAFHGHRRLLSALEQFELWKELADLCESGELEALEDPNESRRRLQLLGVAHFKNGHIKKGEEVIARISPMLESKLPPKPKKTDEASKKKKKPEDSKAQPDDQNATVANAKKPADLNEKKKKTDPKEAAAAKKKAEERKKEEAKEKKRITYAKNALAELKVHQLLAQGKKEKAKEAIAAAKSMNKVRRAQAYLAVGEKEEAAKIAAELVAKPPQSALPAAQAAYLLNSSGKTKEADKAFGQLRELGQAVDLSVPVFARLAPIAKRLSLPEDWRPKLKPNPDEPAEHLFPALGDLGPFRWKPAPASPWKLPDSAGKHLSLADYQDRPVVVVFYLGFGCLHCVEQLQTLAPEVDAFRQAGLEIVAVSTESQPELAKALASYEEEGDSIPFPLLADPELATFRAYRAYDDFEKVPLHGTFLVDALGDVRWQDVSHEPFTEIDFLLKEAKRLLSNDSAKSEVGAK
ncbi:MAG: redoxin domain-containing protein [Opitutae bacterium]|nr:redoxin domain-containing protein [Opitutae bacterium]